MSSPAVTFVEKCLAGEALATDIDDYIDQWHDGGGLGVSLSTYLGLKPDEYALWVERPGSLSFVLFARHNRIALSEALELSDSENALAARAASIEEVQELKSWLKATGRLTS